MTQTLYTSQEIDDKVNKMAGEIIAVYPTTPVFVALLRGAAPFASKLMFAIAKQNPAYHPELDYMTVKTYGGAKTAGAPQIITDISPSTAIAGRDVVIIDDVLDTGVTAKFVREHLLALGAQSAAIAVLVDRLDVRTNGFKPDFYALTAGPEWLIGMGLDDMHTAVEAYRWSESIGVIPQE